jgi:hypothetical protein
MDSNTFGSFQAAKELVKELDKRPFLIRKVAKFIRTYQIGLEHISDIEDRQHKIRIATMWKKDFIDRIDFDPVVDRFVENVMVANYREFIKNIR